MGDITLVGADWIVQEIGALTESIERVRPTSYNERVRFLPGSVTPIPGYLRYDVNPFMREIVDCCDVDSPVREVYLEKGVQITWTTALESVALYFMGHVRTLPTMYVTADRDLAAARIENNFLPMLQQSGLGHILRSSDEGNTRKTGKTAEQLQWEGGGYMVPAGARSVSKSMSYSICVLLKDEVDAWPDVIGKDGDPMKLFDDRCAAFWERRKIFGGGTPKIAGTSKIHKAFLRGDQRRYYVRCKKCGFAQVLRWSFPEGPGGFKWDLDEGGVLILESVRYCCQNCGEPHFEHDKEKLFSPKNGAEWRPTARPVQPDIRSYHLPSMYSPAGMTPWYKCVGQYLDAFDPVARRVKDPDQFQVFYNNILGEPFEVMGSKISFVQVSGHRRTMYALGRVPNRFARQYLGGPILFLVCTVDVQKEFLSVGVFGFAVDAKTCLIDYFRINVPPGADDCSAITSPVWAELRALIDERTYNSDDNRAYRFHVTLIDASYSTDTVAVFCSEYASGVFPILGRDRPAKYQRIKEFAEFKTQLGTTGYRVLVDHYKDRLAPVLRREWSEAAGVQRRYHFNAPIDITDAALKELTVEQRREKRDASGVVSYFWYRPGNARNELFDLLVYAHAAVDIIAWTLCVQYYELDNVDWPSFWGFMLDNMVGIE